MYVTLCAALRKMNASKAADALHNDLERVSSATKKKAAPVKRPTHTFSHSFSDSLLSAVLVGMDH